MENEIMEGTQEVVAEVAKRGFDPRSAAIALGTVVVIYGGVKVVKVVIKKIKSKKGDKIEVIQVVENEESAEEA